MKSLSFKQMINANGGRRPSVDTSLANDLAYGAAWLFGKVVLEPVAAIHRGLGKFGKWIGV